MIKIFCDCCEREITKENRFELVNADMKLGKNAGIDITIDLNQKGREKEEVFCRPCIDKSISKAFAFADKTPKQGISHPHYWFLAHNDLEEDQLLGVKYDGKEVIQLILEYANHARVEHSS